MALDLLFPSPLQLIDDDYLSSGISLYVKRDDLIHPWINGNKWRKLQHQVSWLSPKTKLLTFGGAFSNHLVAVAAYGHYAGHQTIGYVRSYRPDPDNPTIHLLRQWGMDVRYLAPSWYRMHERATEVQDFIRESSSPVHVIPEGGTCAEAIIGTQAIMDEIYDQMDESIDLVALSIGTGGTLAGVANACRHDERVVALSPFRGEVTDLAGMEYMSESARARIEYHSCTDGLRFGAYDERIVDYISAFYERYSVLLDPIYTARSMMTLDQMITRGQVEKESIVVFIHTGGLPGIIGYNYLHRDKKIIDLPDDYKYLQIPSTT